MDDGARRSDPEPTVPARGLTPGAVLGDRYRIERQLGRGGMGEVWQAYDLKLRVEVALKSLRSEFFADDRHREMLRREVRTARDVLSPNVCRIFDLVEIEGQELVSMEYIDGSTLLDLLRNRGPLELREAGEISSQFLAGLEAIHEAGLVHRDMKPENIMITRSGRVVVMDFGIAKGTPKTDPKTDHSGSDATEVLKGGARHHPVADAGGHTIAGTPAYMAPEQMRGDAVDARADVFSAGVILAEMVSASGVKDRETRKSIWAALRQQPAQVPDTPWQSVIRRCVSPHSDERYDSARGLSRALEEITLRVDATDDRTPYPGLATFTEANAEFFFGREAEVEEVWRKLQASQMLAVIGPSGVGKSSFLRAGLIPAAPEGWNCVLATPGHSPFSALAQALAPLLAGDTEAVQELVRFEESDAAISAAQRWRRRHTEALLILDQFEELFTQNPPEVQARFAKLLGRLAFEADVRVLLSLRDDFFFHCHEFSDLAPLFSEPRPLGPPTGASLRRALVQPALICGYRFEDETLVDEMVAELGEARGALPLLAFAAARLWEKRDRDEGQLTRAAYEAIGGVGGALAQHAEATLEKIGGEHQDLVRELFRNLVTSEGTRRSANTDQLLSVFTDQAAAQEVLQTLIDARLLTTYELREEEEDGQHRVEIVHEVLLSSWPRLVRWQTQDADGAQLRDQLRQAAQLWENRNRSDDLLWTGTAFREFQLWRDRYPGGLSKSEGDYAEAMVSRDVRQRRRRRIATISAFAFLAVVLLVVGLSRQQAVRQARRAEAKELLAMGRQYIEEDPTWSLACAIASLERHDDREGRLFALETLWKGPTRFVVPESGGWLVDFSPDGRWLAEDSDNVLRLWSVDGGDPIVFEGFEGATTLLSFHPERAWLLGASQDTVGSVRVWSIPDGDVVFAPELHEQTDAAWGEDGEVLLTATDDGNRSLLWRSWSVDDWDSTVLGGGGTHQDYRTRRVDERGHRFVDYDGVELRVQSFDRLQAGLPPSVLGEHDTDVKVAYLDPSGDHVVSVDGAGEIRLWSSSSETGEPLRIVGRHAAVEGARGDPTGTIIGTCGDEGDAYLWDLTAPPGADALILHRDAGSSTGIAYHPNGDWIALQAQGWLSLWPMTRAYPYVLRSHSEGVRKVVFGPQGEWLASVSGDMTVRTWRLSPDSDEPVWTQEFRDFYDLFDLGVAGTGDKLILGGPCGESTGISLLNRSTGAETPLSLLTNMAVISAVALGPEGRLAAASGTWGVDGPITVWDLESQTSWLLDAGDSTTVLDLQFANDGRLIAGSRSGLRVWDPVKRTHELLQEGPTWNVDVSADGQRIVSSGRSGTFLHDLRTGEALEMTAHQGQAQCAIDPTGEWIVTGNGQSGEIRYGPATGEEVHILLGHYEGVQSLDFDPQGRWIVSSGEDGTIRLWPIPTGEPFHTLPHEELLARLRALTNIRMVPDPDKPGDWKNTYEPFEGWATAPTW